MREDKHFSFIIPEKKIQPAGQLYLGTFLAFALFFSFFFGNLLFFLIVLIISIFIFFEKEVQIADDEGNIYVEFNEHGFIYGKKEVEYKNLLSFTFHSELFGEQEINLRLTFKNPGKPDQFIQIADEMQRQNIYDIIRRHVKEESKQELSFVDSLVLRFF